MIGKNFSRINTFLLLVLVAACASLPPMDLRRHKDQAGVMLVLPSAIDLKRMNGTPVDVLIIGQKQKALMIDSGESTLEFQYLDFYINMDHDEEKISSGLMVFKADLPAGERLIVEIPEDIQNISQAHQYAKNPQIVVRQQSTGAELQNQF